VRKNTNLKIDYILRTSHKSLKRKTTLKLKLRWKRNYEEKEINEEGRRSKCGNIFVTSRECACSQADQEINEEGRRRKCGDKYL